MKNRKSKRKGYIFTESHRKHLSESHLGINRIKADKNFEIYTKEQVDSLNVKEYEKGYYIDKQGNAYRIFIENDIYYVKKIIPSTTSLGYLQCGAGLIHNMVAEVYIGPKPDGYVIEHIDKNKLNNYVENLQYITKKESNQKQEYKSTHQKFGRYDWNRQFYYSPSPKKEKIKMTPEQYVQHILNTRGIGVAKKIIRKAKQRNIIININEIQQNDKEQNSMEIKVGEMIGVGKSIIYLYYFDAYKNLINKDNKFLCRLGCIYSDDISKIFGQSYKFMPEYPKLALVIKTDNPNELLTTIQFILKNRNKSKINVTDPSWFITSPEEIKEIYNLILGN